MEVATDNHRTGEMSFAMLAMLDFQIFPEGSYASWLMSWFGWDGP